MMHHSRSGQQNRDVGRRDIKGEECDKRLKNEVGKDKQMGT